MVSSPLGLPAVGFSDWTALSNSTCWSCSGCPVQAKLPQRLQQNSMKEQKEEGQKAARTGRHSLILPGSAGKLFPNSPNQKPFTAMVLKSRKKSTLDPRMVLQPEMQNLITVGIGWSSSDVLNKSINSLL